MSRCVGVVLRQNLLEVTSGLLYDWDHPKKFIRQCSGGAEKKAQKQAFICPIEVKCTKCVKRISYLFHKISGLLQSGSKDRIRWNPGKVSLLKKMKVTSSGHCIFACCMTRSYNKHKHFKIIHKIKLFMTSFSTINTVCPVKEIIFCNSCLSLYKTCNICLVILFATYFGTFFNLRMNVSV